MANGTFYSVGDFVSALDTELGKCFFLPDTWNLRTGCGH